MCFSWTQCGCRDLSVIPRLLERISCSLLRASHLATQKNLPIGIILSFVLLTSMKLRPLLTFCSFVLYFFMLYVATIFGVMVRKAQTALLK